MTRVNLLRADVGWHLYTLRTTISNLVFYFDVPGDEMAAQGWRDSIRQDVQDRFQNAIGTDDLLRIIDRNTLTNRRSDALTLISILHTNAGMKRDDWGQDVPVSVKNLRQFCIDLEKLEREADIQGDSPPVATNNSIETVLTQPANKLNPIPADSGQQSGQSKKIVPDNPDVAKLANKIRRERNDVPNMIDIARDFTNGDEGKAENLLRQLRRYKHLLD